MSFLQRLLKLIRQSQEKGAFFNSTDYELKNFLCGIGEATVDKDFILIKKYPFRPSTIYSHKKLTGEDIDAICLTSYPPLLKIGHEVIFVSREYHEELKTFVVRHNIKTFEATNNWDWILAPYVDTEYTDEDDLRIKKLLAQNSIDEVEVESIRAEVGEQMLKYNFDTILWEWGGLGLSDVLCAMRVKYNKDEFQTFYAKAMEIELRQ